MADITQTPTSDDLTVRATASLRAMHDRVLAEGGIDPFTHAILMLIRAIIAYLAIPLEPATTTKSTAAPHATAKSIRQRAHATFAPSIRVRAKRLLCQNPRTRRSNRATPHQSTQTRARIISRAPLLPDLPQTI